jgi:aminopeptidase N
VWRERSIPAGQPLIDFAQCFWRPTQHELLVPWAHRYLDELTHVAGGGLLALGSLVRHMRPTTCDAAWLDHAQDVADSAGLPPAVRTPLLMGVDILSRMLAAQA